VIAPTAPLARDIAPLSKPVENVVVVREEKRSIISDVTTLLSQIETSVTGLGPELTTLLGDLENLDITAVLNDIKSDLAGDVTLVDEILADVGVGVDLTSVTALIDVVIDIVEGLVTTVDGLLADTAVGGLVSDIEGLLSEILKGLGSLV
jgi:hypothetical protein